MQLRRFSVASVLLVGAILFASVGYARGKRVDPPTPGTVKWQWSTDESAQGAMPSSLSMALSNDKSILYFMCNVGGGFKWCLFAANTDQSAQQRLAFLPVPFFLKPRYIAPAPDGSVYVSRSASKGYKGEISRVSSNGNVIGRIVVDGLMPGPCAIGNDGTIYFANARYVFADTPEGSSKYPPYKIWINGGPKVHTIKRNPVLRGSEVDTPFLCKAPSFRYDPSYYLCRQETPGWSTPESVHFSYLGSDDGDCDLSSFACIGNCIYVGGYYLACTPTSAHPRGWWLLLSAYTISAQNWIAVGNSTLCVAAYYGEKPELLVIKPQQSNTPDVAQRIDFSGKMNQIIGVCLGVNKDNKGNDVPYAFCNGKDGRGYLESVEPNGSYKQVWSCDNPVVAFVVDSIKKIAYVLTTKKDKYSTNDAYVYA